MEAIIPALLQYGMPGILLLVLGYFAWTKDRDLKAISEKRVEEARELGKQLLEMSKQWNETLGTLADTVKASSAGLAEVRKVMEKTNDVMIGCKHNRASGGA